MKVDADEKIPSYTNLVFRVKALTKTIAKYDQGRLVCPGENGIKPKMHCEQCKLCWAGRPSAQKAAAHHSSCSLIRCAGRRSGRRIFTPPASLKAGVTRSYTMHQEVLEVARAGLPNLETTNDVVALCRKISATLAEHAYNKWVFTRYVKRFDTRFVNNRTRRIGLNWKGSQGQKIAVGIAAFAKNGSSSLYVGGAACNPGNTQKHGDKWNRHVGRALAALGLWHIPLPLATALCIAETPWDTRMTIEEKRLRSSLRPPWSTLVRQGIPLMALPAIVDACRQSIRYRLFNDAEFRLPTISGRTVKLGLIHTQARHEALSLTAQLIDAAYHLPAKPQLTPDERQSLEILGRERHRNSCRAVAARHRQPPAMSVSGTPIC
jgi:hypothetical protein